MNPVIQHQPLRKSVLDYVVDFFLFFWDLFVIVLAWVAARVILTYESYKETFKDDPHATRSKIIMWSCLLVSIAIASMFIYNTWQMMHYRLY